MTIIIMFEVTDGIAHNGKCFEDIWKATHYAEATPDKALMGYDYLTFELAYAQGVKRRDEGKVQFRLMDSSVITLKQLRKLKNPLTMLGVTK